MALTRSPGLTPSDLYVIREGGEPEEVTVHDGLLSVAIGVAAHRSIDEQRPVMMSEVLG